MPLQLESAHKNARFEQGEILLGCIEPIVSEAPLFKSSIEAKLGREIERTELAGHLHYRVNALLHSFAMVVSRDCDLEQDFKAREADNPEFANLYRNEKERERFRSQGTRNELTNLLLSPLWSPTEMSNHSQVDTYKQVMKSNNHPRWCRVGPLDWSSVGFEHDSNDLIIDCGYTFVWPMAAVIADENSVIARIGRIPSPYREHYLQRISIWQSMIGVPDIE